ncbi:MAG: extracellular solute-binding protein, partial [Pseudomonadota bacterium]
QFEQETGINVEIDAQPVADLRSAQIAEMSGPEGRYDLVSWALPWKTEYASEGLLSPLSQFFAQPRLADPEYNIADFSSAYVTSGGVVGGTKGYLKGTTGALYGVPFGAETSILAYRKDVLEKHGLAVPKTYEELRAAMLTLAQAKVPALASRGQSSADLTHAFLLHLSPLGGQIFDEAWEPQFTAPAAIEAAEFLRFVMQTGSSTLRSSGFANAALSFLQGETAMYLDTIKIGELSRDPNISMIADQVGFALHPSAATCGAGTDGFAIGIPANSDNANAAFLLLQYLTSKSGDRRIVELGGTPSRITTLFEFYGERPEFPIVAEQLQCADPDWRPLIAEWDALQETVIGPALKRVLDTKLPVAEIMEDANTAALAIMEEAGYYTWQRSTTIVAGNEVAEVEDVAASVTE